MRSGISIRAATSEDSHLLFRLGADTFAETFSADNTPRDMAAYLAEAFSPEIQARELSAAASYFLIAEADAQPVGYARLLESPAPAEIGGVRPVEIVRLYSRASWIGAGVGSSLMQACLDKATALGCDTLWLGVWEKNRRAIAFYEKWGFARAGSHPFHLGDDVQTDWLMSRPVAAGAV